MSAFDQVYEAIQPMLPANSMVAIAVGDTARLIGKLRGISGEEMGRMFRAMLMTVQQQIDAMREQARRQGGDAALAEFERGLNDLSITGLWVGMKEHQPGDGG